LNKWLFPVLFSVLFLVPIGTQNAFAEIFGGIDFPAGESSFADAVIRYDPLFRGGPAPTAPTHTNPDEALGPPDFVFPNGAVSLGRIGLLEVQFTDNFLTNSGDATPDLHIFLVGDGVEDIFVLLRPTPATLERMQSMPPPVFPVGEDGFIGIGPFRDSVSIDIDSGFRLGGQPGNAFVYDAVAIADFGGAFDLLQFIGADVDAVGAITSIPPSVVPNIIGLHEFDAKGVIAEAILEVGLVTKENSNTVPEDFVIRQDPAPGTIVTPTSEVNFVVSSGPSANSPPVADDKTQGIRPLTGPPETIDVITILLSGSDPEGDPLTFSIKTPPSFGTLGPVVPIDSTTAKVEYSAELSFLESLKDSFTFVANDGDADSNIATVTMLSGELKIFKLNGEVEPSPFIGGEVFTNGDNDDRDDKFDLDDNNGVIGEDDLIKLQVSFPGDPDDGLLELFFGEGSDKVQVWTEPSKENRVDLPVEVTDGQEFWIEGIKTSDFPRDVSFILGLVPAGETASQELTFANVTVSPGYKLIFYYDDRNLNPFDFRVGHAFLQFRPNVGQQEGNKDLVYGLTIPGGFKIFGGPGFVTGPPPGGGPIIPQSDREDEGDYDEPIHHWAARVIYEVDTADYNRAATFLNNAASKPPNYHLLKFNCVDFAESVADAAGVKLPDAVRFFNVKDPQKAVNDLEEIGHGGTFPFNGREARVEFNLFNTFPNDTPDPPLPMVDFCSIENYVIAAQAGQATLAENIGFDFNQETLEPVNVNVGDQCKVTINNVDIDNAITITDFGEGSPVLQTLESTHMYDSEGLREARVIVIINGIIHEFLFNFNVGGGDDLCEVSVDIPDPPILPPFTQPDPPALIAFDSLMGPPPPQPTVVGGEFLPIDTTSLLVAGAQTFSWMIPVILSGIGIGLFVAFRKSE